MTARSSFSKSEDKKDSQLDGKDLNENVYQIIPQAIRALVSDRHLLSSEDSKSYDALFGVLVEHYAPKDAMGWLAVKN